ncbi:18678_t:CDS:2, partial [Gigaspora margarita]
MNSTSILCNSIFIDTHPELLSLHQQIEEFQITYQSNVEAIFNNSIEQCSYNQEELDESIITDKSNINEAQYKKLQTIICCNNKCLQKTTIKGQKHSRLASKNIFEGVEICSNAFLTIYRIGEKYWRNIGTHFIQQEISPRIHKLTNKNSNFAIPFETILNILTFIINYANIHGLPSP